MNSDNLICGVSSTFSSKCILGFLINKIFSKELEKKNPTRCVCHSAV